MRNVLTFAGSVLAVGVLVLGGSRAWTMAERDRKGARGVALYEDINSLRQIVSRIAARGELPMKDGALDPYFFVRNGDLKGVNIKLLRSNLHDIGPTEEEALRGDYTRFPWERYRGTATRIGERAFPLLWGPLWRGGWIVGFSDGSVKTLEADEFARLDLGR